MDTVLIVDDMAINREMLKCILQEEYNIIEAGDGEEAVHIIKSQADIDAILLDIVMPKMDGYDVLRYLRDDSSVPDIPVVIETENSAEQFEIKALQLGATDFVTKPYNASAIRMRLRNVINTRKMISHIARLEEDGITGLMSLNSFLYEGIKWINECPEDSFDVVAEDIAYLNVLSCEDNLDGDRYIVTEMASRVKDVMNKVKFLCARIYGDKFVFLFKRREGYMERLIENTKELTMKCAHRIEANCKFGIYQIEEGPVKLEKCIGRAFTALNTIKGKYGIGWAFYDEELHKKSILERKINDEMADALKNGQFLIYLQPKYDITAGTIAGAEALVRWQHPESGLVSPGTFIPLFEKNGFICELDRYVWNKTAGIISQWKKENRKVIPVSVNVSRKDIELMNIVEVLLDIVHRYDIDPSYLHLEITETAYIQDSNKIIEVVEQLKKEGFIIEMDDFGSGYSSLNMLASLPIDILKLDMMFIQSIEKSGNAKTIIEYTINLAKWMKLPVVAEGVETKEQLDLLRQFECNFVQGFMFAKPMPIDSFEQLMNN